MIKNSKDLQMKKGILIISDKEEMRKKAGRSTITEILESKVKEINEMNFVSDKWCVIDLMKFGHTTTFASSIYRDKPDKWPLNDPNFYGVDQIGLLIIHLNNDDGVAREEYFKKGGALTTILTSGSPDNVDWKIFVKTLFEDEEKPFRNNVLYVGSISERYENIGYWFEYWIKKHNGDPQALPETYEILTRRFSTEEEELFSKSMEILNSFFVADYLIQGYLAIHDWKKEKINGQTWEEFKKEKKILHSIREKKTAEERTRNSRLFRPLSDTSNAWGYYWFDECAKNIKECQLFSESFDQIIERILKLVKKKKRVAEPALPMIHSRKSIKNKMAHLSLRIFWELFGSHYKNKESHRQECRKILPPPYNEEFWFKKADKVVVIKLLKNAHLEYQAAIKKIAAYLGM